MRSCQSFGAALLAAMAVGVVFPAFADVGALKPVHSGQITYVTGGYGEGEQHSLEADAKDYNLAITNAIKNGEFTAGTDLAIQSTTGRSLLRVNDTGPLFYAKLPPGRYVVRAMNGTEKRVRDVTIAANQPSDLHLIWHQAG
jgi:hypothetical protein